MSLFVLKFGGSSVATTSRIVSAALIVKKLLDQSHKVIVVTSAMFGTTNQLLDQAKVFSQNVMDREFDAIISSGEQVTAGLFALSLRACGIDSTSLLGWQIPIVSEDTFSSADINSICPKKIQCLLNSGIVPVIAGFQGINSKGEITTFGRGGSDATAVAIAYAMRADECFIYTDVDGIYTADPRIVLNSKRINAISYKEMLELSSNGAKVLQSRSVLIAYNCAVKLRVLSSFLDVGETKIMDEIINIPKKNRITALAHNISCFKASVFTNDINFI